MWRWELVSVTGVALGELHARGRELTLARRSPGSARFTLTLREAAELADLLRLAEVDLLVTRGNVPLFRGPIAGADVTLAEVGGSVTFAAVGIAELLADRYTDAPYELLAMEQTTVAWQLIENTQAKPGGDLGIVAGALPASQAISVEWQTPTAILGAINGLASAAQGFDWTITPVGTGWRFDAFYPRMGAVRGAVYERGRNIRAQAGVSLDAGAGRVVTDATAIGAGGVSVRAEDVTARALYRRREAVVTVDGTDAHNAVVLGDRARAALAGGVRPLPRFELLAGAADATMDDVGIGDIVTVRLREGWLDLTGTYSVEELVAKPDEGDPEAIVLSVAPYS